MAVLLLVSSRAMAQYDPSFSHYWATEPMFNPAAVGKESKLNVAGVYNMTLVGFENSPSTMYAAADMPFRILKSYHGGGLRFLSDNIGLFSHTTFSLQYAFRFRLFGGQLGVGINFSLLSESFDGSKVDTEMSDDPAFPSSQVDGTGVDFGAGLYYTHRNWYAGISLAHAFAPTIKLGDVQEFDIDRIYYLTAGYNIKLRNPLLSIHPSMLTRTDMTEWRVDITARLMYNYNNKILYAGVGYSPTNSITVFVGGDFHGIMLGYSYEIYTSSVSFGNGSHEIFIGYQTDLDLQKKGRNRHKSVRLL